MSTVYYGDKIYMYLYNSINRGYTMPDNPVSQVQFISLEKRLDRLESKVDLVKDEYDSLNTRLVRMEVKFNDELKIRVEEARKEERASEKTKMLMIDIIKGAIVFVITLLGSRLLG